MSTPRMAMEELRRKLRAALGRRTRADFLACLPAGAVGAEIGVFRGGFSRLLLQRTDPRELHLIDGWSRLHGARYPNWGRYTLYGRLTTARALADVRDVLRRHDRRNACVIHEEDDRVCANGFADGYFDWVYIDSAHEYAHDLALLEAVRPKMKPQGLIAGHDWRPDPAHPHHGVYRAVTEFCGRHGWSVVKLDDFTQWCIARRTD